ncbi:MAG: hypothetical protein VW338_04095, partial [Rhodospirillaceae bacterium]
GNRKLTEVARRVSPWWVTDAKGDVYLSVRSGLKRIEFERGKTAIRVGAPSKLESVLKTLISATEAGEMDALMARAMTVPKKN